MASLGVEKIDPGNTGGTLHHEDFDLTFVPAWHSLRHVRRGPLDLSRRLLRARHRRRSEGKTVYHMGDTAIFSDMGLINEIYRPQIGFVPIGDRFTMGAKTAALACKRFFEFETDRALPLRDLSRLDQTADKFVAEMGGNTVRRCPRSGVALRGLRPSQGYAQPS